jgi:hypothetical protein
VSRLCYAGPPGTLVWGAEAACRRRVVASPGVPALRSAGMSAAAPTPPTFPPARDFAELAIQVARLDECTLAMQRELGRVQDTMATRAELRTWGAIILLALAGLFTAVLMLPQRLGVLAAPPSPSATAPAH